jgi:hypothetical protein
MKMKPFDHIATIAPPRPIKELAKEIFDLESSLGLSHGKFSRRDAMESRLADLRARTKSPATVSTAMPAPAPATSQPAGRDYLGEYAALPNDPIIRARWYRANKDGYDDQHRLAARQPKPRQRVSTGSAIVDAWLAAPPLERAAFAKKHGRAIDAFYRQQRNSKPN